MDINQPGVRIQVMVRQQTEHGEFQDAMYYSAAEFAALTEAEFSVAKQARVDKWLESVKPPEPEPTPAELTTEAEGMHDHLDEIYEKVPALIEPRLTELAEKSGFTLTKKPEEEPEPPIEEEPPPPEEEPKEPEPPIEPDPTKPPSEGGK